MKLGDLPLGSEYLKEAHLVWGIDYAVLKQNEKNQTMNIFSIGKKNRRLQVACDLNIHVLYVQDTLTAYSHWWGSIEQWNRCNLRLFMFPFLADNRGETVST